MVGPVERYPPVVGPVRVPVPGRVGVFERGAGVDLAGGVYFGALFFCAAHGIAAMASVQKAIVKIRLSFRTKADLAGTSALLPNFAASTESGETGLSRDVVPHEAGQLPVGLAIEHNTDYLQLFLVN